MIKMFEEKIITLPLDEVRIYHNALSGGWGVAFFYQQEGDDLLKESVAREALSTEEHYVKFPYDLLEQLVNLEVSFEVFGPGRD